MVLPVLGHSPTLTALKPNKFVEHKKLNELIIDFSCLLNLLKQARNLTRLFAVCARFF